MFKYNYKCNEKEKQNTKRETSEVWTGAGFKVETLKQHQDGDAYW